MIDERKIPKVSEFRIVSKHRIRRRKRRIRRLVSVVFLAGVLVFAGYFLYGERLARLNDEYDRLAYYQARYEELTLRRGFYLNEIIRLEDEDFIAMLARERHLHADEDEIIFIFDDATDSGNVDEEY